MYVRLWSSVIAEKLEVADTLYSRPTEDDDDDEGSSLSPLLTCFTDQLMFFYWYWEADCFLTTQCPIVEFSPVSSSSIIGLITVVFSRHSIIKLGLCLATLMGVQEVELRGNKRPHILPSTRPHSTIKGQFLGLYLFKLKCAYERTTPPVDRQKHEGGEIRMAVGGGVFGGIVFRDLPFYVYITCWRYFADTFLTDAWLNSTTTMQTASVLLIVPHCCPVHVSLWWTRLTQ